MNIRKFFTTIPNDRKETQDFIAALIRCPVDYRDLVDTLEKFLRILDTKTRDFFLRYVGEPFPVVTDRKGKPLQHSPDREAIGLYQICPPIPRLPEFLLAPYEEIYAYESYMQEIAKRELPRNQFSTVHVEARTLLHETLGENARLPALAAILQGRITKKLFAEARAVASLQKLPEKKPEPVDYAVKKSQPLDTALCISSSYPSPGIDKLVCNFKAYNEGISRRTFVRRARKLLESGKPILFAASGFFVGSPHI